MSRSFISEWDQSMTEEEARQLKQEKASLKEEAAQKDRRIEELEGLLMSALLRIEELERRLAKNSHYSSKPPSSDGFLRKGKPRKKSGKASGG
jgi:predicted RNase H-like nuclease (RuvC/YqgF family)